MPIRTKIITLFIVVALVPYAVVALFVYSDISAEAERNALNTVNLLATIQKNRTLELLSKYSLQINQFTSRLQLRDSLATYLSTGDAASLGVVKRIIADAKKGTENIHEIDILSLRGIVLASTNASHIGLDQSDAASFKKGLAGEDTSVFFKEGGTVYLYLAGVLAREGAKIGVVVLSVETDDLFALFHDYTGLGETGSWGLAMKTESGDALFIVPGRFDTDPDSPLKAVTKNTPENRDLPIMHAIRGDEATFGELTNYLGHKVLAATRHIPEMQWGIGVTQDRAEALASSHSLAQQLVFFSALILIFIVFLSSVISHIVTRPVRDLSEAASRVASGDLSVAIPSNSKDEIGALARTFNTMIAELRSSRDDLESKVRDRTKEVEEKLTEVERLNKLMVGRELKMIELKEEIARLKGGSGKEV